MHPPFPHLQQYMALTATFLRSIAELKYLPVFPKAITLQMRDILKIGKVPESPPALQCLAIFDRAAQSYHMEK